jgi:hypothetical protein
MTNKLDRLQRTRKNFDIRETSQEQKNGDVLTGTGLVAEKAAHICYEPQLAPEQEQRKQHFGRRYRIGGTTHINLPQSSTSNLRSTSQLQLALPSLLTASFTGSAPMLAMTLLENCSPRFVRHCPSGSVVVAFPSRPYGHARSFPAVKLRSNMLTFFSICPTLGSKAPSSSA